MGNSGEHHRSGLVKATEVRRRVIESSPLELKVVGESSTEGVPASGLPSRFHLRKIQRFTLPNDQQKRRRVRAVAIVTVLTLLVVGWWLKQRAQVSTPTTAPITRIDPQAPKLENNPDPQNATPEPMKPAQAPQAPVSVASSVPIAPSSGQAPNNSRRTRQSTTKPAESAVRQVLVTPSPSANSPSTKPKSESPGFESAPFIPE